MMVSYYIDDDQTRTVVSETVAIRHSKSIGRYYVETWHAGRGGVKPHWHSAPKAVYEDFPSAVRYADVLRRRHEGLI